MNFLKVHGLGNDFVLVDSSEERDLPEGAEELAGLAVKICDRNFGVGADGLVLLKPAEDADVYMQIFNSDGSEAEMCGNAIRCAARYLYEKGLARGNSLRIKTLAGIMVPEIISLGGREIMVRVDMGEPVLERKLIPMIGDPGMVVGEPLEWEGNSFRVTAVSMGNPHCVIFTGDVEKVPLALWGPGIENHPAFPGKTNVEFVQVLNRGEACMRVWERGAGPTLACGTGACACAVACILNGLTDRNVRVFLKAGHLHIEWKEENNRIYMTGPAEVVFRGEYYLR
ncbi:MAG: diaminopimelate epimerase [Desulfocucumaceae bacterium]